MERLTGDKMTGIRDLGSPGMGITWRSLAQVFFHLAGVRPMEGLDMCAGVLKE
jgi:hypothetical protein